MGARRRLGILTGGGDVPGLNAVIKSVVYRSTELGYEVVGFRRGWQGLTNYQPGAALDTSNAVLLDRANTRAIDRTGGTILHTSRINPSRLRAAELPAHLDPAARERLRRDDDRYDLTSVVLDKVHAVGLDALITIGGDDTLSFA